MSQFGFMLFGLLFTASVYAQHQTDALQARDEALRALKGFNPATVLKDYTANPQESRLQPQEGSDALSAHGLNALKTNEAAKQVYSEAVSRAKVQSNPLSPQMQYAETLLENAESVLHGVVTRFEPKAQCI